MMASVEIAALQTIADGAGLAMTQLNGTLRMQIADADPACLKLLSNDQAISFL